MKDYLTEWNEKGLDPATKEDENIINKCLDEEIDLYYDNLLHVYTESGIYIADLKEIE